MVDLVVVVERVTLVEELVSLVRDMLEEHMHRHHTGLEVVVVVLVVLVVLQRSQQQVLEELVLQLPG
jgi:hypothetical protein